MVLYAKQKLDWRGIWYHKWYYEQSFVCIDLEFFSLMTCCNLFYECISLGMGMYGISVISQFEMISCWVYCESPLYSSNNYSLVWFQNKENEELRIKLSWNHFNLNSVLMYNKIIPMWVAKMKDLRGKLFWGRLQQIVVFPKEYMYNSYIYIVHLH